MEFKRQRGVNFSKAEKDLFRQLVSPRLEVIDSKMTDGLTNRKKLAVWEVVCNEFNSHPWVTRRTLKQLKILHDNLKRRCNRQAVQKLNVEKTSGLSLTSDPEVTVLQLPSVLPNPVPPPLQLLPPAFSEIKLKRQRGHNFSKAEKDLLVRLVSDRLEIIDSKMIDGLTIRKKWAAWEEVCNEFHSHSWVTNRSIKQLKNLHENLKRSNKSQPLENVSVQDTSAICLNDVKAEVAAVQLSSVPSDTVSTFPLSQSPAPLETHFKKQRGTNFSKEEKDLLVRLVSSRLEIIDSKINDSITIQKKWAAWNEVHSEFNSHPWVIPRSVKQLKVLHENFKKRNRNWAENLSIQKTSDLCLDDTTAEVTVLQLPSTPSNPVSPHPILLSPPLQETPVEEAPDTQHPSPFQMSASEPSEGNCPKITSVTSEMVEARTNVEKLVPETNQCDREWVLYLEKHEAEMQLIKMKQETELLKQETEKLKQEVLRKQLNSNDVIYF